MRLKKSNIEIWVQGYKAQGNEGLFATRVHREYDFEFKMNAVCEYLQFHLSYSVVSEQLGISNGCLLCTWVNMYRKHGPVALRPKKHGRKRNMPLENKESIDLDQSQDHDSMRERLKKLEDENYWLRLDNAILKEARRLRLEEEAKLNAKR